MTGGNGSLTSPNYPDDYPNSLDCEWTITVTEGNLIRANLEDFVVQHCQDCRCDVLRVCIIPHGRTG